MERQVAVTAMPTELAVLLVGVAARQAASPTACIQARLDVAVPVDRLFAPQDGAFHGSAAAALLRWKQE